MPSHQKEVGHTGCDQMASESIQRAIIAVAAAVIILGREKRTMQTNGKWWAWLNLSSFASQARVSRTGSKEARGEPRTIEVARSFLV